MVLVHEKIKEVVRISRTLDMMAINAMLVAKRAGTRSKGFGVVSAELRVFSRKLNDEMACINNEIAALVRHTAELQKLDRMNLHLEAAMALDIHNSDLLATVLKQKTAIRQAATGKIDEDALKFQSLLGRAVKLCDVSYSLTRSAKVEAVYGGEMSGILKQLAERIEDVISPLPPLLKSLRSGL